MDKKLFYRILLVLLIIFIIIMILTFLGIIPIPSGNIPTQPPNFWWDMIPI